MGKDLKGVPLHAEGNYAIFYTCNVCETKQSRSFTKKSYHQGVVIVRCEGCQNLHLIADNLKWFEDEPLNIETIAKRSNQPLLKIKAEGDL